MLGTAPPLRPQNANGVLLRNGDRILLGAECLYRVMDPQLETVERVRGTITGVTWAEAMEEVARLHGVTSSKVPRGSALGAVDASV